MKNFCFDLRNNYSSVFSFDNHNVDINWVQKFIGFSDVRFYSSGRLTNDQKNSYVVTGDLHNIIIGCSLGDLNINKRGKTSRLRFKQGLNHIDYINHLFGLFSDYCNVKEPKRHSFLDKRSNTITTTFGGF